MFSGMPSSVYQPSRSAHQYSHHLAPSSGGTKYSISIISNSRVRKTKLPGVISFRKDLPCWAMPKGGFFRVEFRTFRKLTNMPWAVSGRRYAVDASSSTGPTNVLNIRLNARASVNESLAPQFGQIDGSSIWSSRKRSLHLRQSTNGSVKLARWPLASQIFGLDRMAASIATTSSRSCTIDRHHASFTLRSINEP